MNRRLKLRLKEICEFVGMSERELAQHLDLSLIALRSINRSDPPRYLRLAVCCILAEINPDDIFAKLVNKRDPHFDN